MYACTNRIGLNTRNLYSKFRIATSKCSTMTRRKIGVFAVLDGGGVRSIEGARWKEQRMKELEYILISQIVQKRSKQDKGWTASLRAWTWKKNAAYVSRP